MHDRIMTLHPDPSKAGVNIDRGRYDLVRAAILDALSKGHLTFRQLTDAVRELLPAFDGSVSWYVTTVKLDLEARGIVARVPKSRPQLVYRTDKRIGIDVDGRGR